MGDDIERIIIGNEWTKVETRYVLYTIFNMYARGQFLISTDFIAQSLDLSQKLRMSLSEILTTLFRTCIKNRSICQDDTGRHHHTIAVGMHATVHA